MAQRYANTMLLFLLVLFYGILNPLLYLIGMCGMLFQMMIEKYVLINRHKIPEVVGSTIPKFFANMIVPYIFICSFAHLMMMLHLSGGVQWVPTILLLFSFFFLMIPFRTMIGWL